MSEFLEWSEKSPNQSRKPLPFCPIDSVKPTPEFGFNWFTNSFDAFDLDSSAICTENHFYGIMEHMKTTLDIPDELMKEVKIRAVVESKKLNQLIPELLQIGLAQPTPSGTPGRKRLELPLTPAKPGQNPFNITPQSLHELELQDEMERNEAPLR